MTGYFTMYACLCCLLTRDSNHPEQCPTHGRHYVIRLAERVECPAPLWGLHADSQDVLPGVTS